MERRQLKSTTTTSLTTRKAWSRTVSKAAGHSRAHKDLLAHLAYRASNGEVWSYSLAALAEESGVSERHVRRGLDLFAAQRIITINRRGPKASQYTLNFEVDKPQRVDMVSG